MLFGLCAAGLFSGFIARRLVPDQADPTTSHQGAPATAVPSAGEIFATIPDKNPQPAKLQIPHVRSIDTVETLLAADEGTLYRRLAHWLGDASEQEIAAYWAGYQKGERDDDCANIVFIHWTRLNPQAAIAAVAGSDDECYAWWAWACHDPGKSLAAALAADSERVADVVGGIAAYRPAWLRAHFKEIPESAHLYAMPIMEQWPDIQNPLEWLRFMKKYGSDSDDKTFKALAQKDPWSALDWIKENPGPGSDERMEILLATMGSEHPDDLKRLAAQTSSGELKRKMEAALFDNLLATDPTAAMEQAKATDVPVIAADRMAKVGLSLIESSPEQAFEMANHILANSGSLNHEKRVEGKDGLYSVESSRSVSVELMEALLAKDPARVLEMAKPYTAFHELTGKWAAKDVIGYTNWVSQQTDPAIRESAAGALIKRLGDDCHYQEAVEWATSSEQLKSNYLPGNLANWQRSNPEEAAAWLESSNLTDAEKAKLNKAMEAYR